jgi:hypothetical protein
LETLLDLKSWCWMGLLILHAIPAGAINVFGPLVVRGFGYDGYDVMLFLIPYGALQVISMVGSYVRFPPSTLERWLKSECELPVAFHQDPVQVPSGRRFPRPVHNWHE